MDHTDILEQMLQGMKEHKREVGRKILTLVEKFIAADPPEYWDRGAELLKLLYQHRLFTALAEFSGLLSLEAELRGMTPDELLEEMEKRGAGQLWDLGFTLSCTYNTYVHPLLCLN